MDKTVWPGRPTNCPRIIGCRGTFSSWLFTLAPHLGGYESWEPIRDEGPSWPTLAMLFLSTAGVRVWGCARFHLRFTERSWKTRNCLLFSCILLRVWLEKCVRGFNKTWFLQLFFFLVMTLA
jgi:hypothetical protein